MRIGLNKYTIDKERLPKSLIFSGLTTFIICSLLAVGLLLYIPIQNKIVGKAYIHPSGLDMPIKAGTTGKIHYMIRSNESLEANQIIATVDWKLSEFIINQLEELYAVELDRYSTDELNRIKDLCKELKGVQIYQLSDKIEALSGTIDLYYKRRNVANREELISQYNVTIEQQRAYQDVLRSKESIVRERRELLLAQASNDSTLFKIGAISVRELERQASDILRVNEELIVIEQELSDVSREISKVNQELIDVKTNFSIRLNDYQLEILSTLNDYKTTYLRESERRIIRAPGSGKVFIDQVAINESFINEGDIIAQLINYTNQVNYVELTAERLGEVRQGQSVYIDLDEYEVNDVGYLKASVSSIDAVRQADGTQKVLLELTNQLSTTLGDKLNPDRSYTGKAKIITSRKTVGQSIIANITRSLTELQQE